MLAFDDSKSLKVHGTTYVVKKNYGFFGGFVVVVKGLGQ